MKPSAKTGAALTITALSLVVTVGAGASGSIIPVDESWLGRGPGVPQRASPRETCTSG